MEIKRILKLKSNEGIAKRGDFPNNFQELIEKAKVELKKMYADMRKCVNKFKQFE